MYETGSFLTTFAEVAIRKIPDKADALHKLFGSLREVIGFPRGATYTDWRKRGGKAANASLTVETTADGADVILNPMEGSNSADAAWTLAGYVARALYPDIVTDGKTTVQRAEHAKFKAMLGIDRQGGEVIFSDWPELPYPPPIYHGSPLPDADRAMISFAVSDESGNATKRMAYFSLATGSGPVALDPRWHQAAWTFVKAGFEHILDGPDHLLFLLCLIVPFRRIEWNLVWVITSFTLAHSMTLIAAAYGFVPSGAWFQPLVEVLIAASILYVAIENVVRPNVPRRWMLSGLFGLVHGFAFSFLLGSQLQFAGSHLLVSLLAFNVGIELGQLVVLLVALPILGVIYRAHAIPDRMFVAIVSLVVGHSAWHWLIERVEALRKVGWSPEPVPIEPLAAAAHHGRCGPALACSERTQDGSGRLDACAAVRTARACGTRVVAARRLDAGVAVQ